MKIKVDGFSSGGEGYSFGNGNSAERRPLSYEMKKFSLKLALHKELYKSVQDRNQR
jgi:hypothetical protein